jgi:hypothetical protein
MKGVPVMGPGFEPTTIDLQSSSLPLDHDNRLMSALESEKILFAVIVYKYVHLKIAGRQTGGQFTYSLL